MKVIDLLNRIANNEEVPEKIKKYGYVYTYHNGVDYKNEDGGYLFGNSICICSDDLNSTVEIIEEDKEIEEIKSHYVLGLDESLERVIEWQKENNKIYEDKINEIIKNHNKIMELFDKLKKGK